MHFILASLPRSPVISHSNEQVPKIRVKSILALDLRAIFQMEMLGNFSKLLFSSAGLNLLGFQQEGTPRKLLAELKQ